MRRLVVIASLFACTLNASSQQVSAQPRAREIADAFAKSKHVVRERHGVLREKYKDVRSAPAAKQDVASYTGVYEVSELGYEIDLRVARDGRVEGNGYDAGPSGAFRLANARIDGALLTASKVYSDGTAERLEGAFLDRTVRESPTDAGTTNFGLGVLLTTPLERDGLSYEKLFYQRREEGTR